MSDNKIITLNNIERLAEALSRRCEQLIASEIENVNSTIDEKEQALKARIEELEAALNPELVTIEVVEGKLELTRDKYQTVNNLVDGTELIFPSVTSITELHLYFDAETNMNLVFPDCKWRVEPNIEECKSYEVIAFYNTIQWLVTVVSYS